MCRLQSDIRIAPTSQNDVCIGAISAICLFNFSIMTQITRNLTEIDRLDSDEFDSKQFLDRLMRPRAIASIDLGKTSKIRGR